MPHKAFESYPLGIRYNLLLHFGGGSSVGADLDYYHEATKLEQIIVDRNLRGKALEKEGRVEEAIQLYEQNVADCVDTPFPYRRLRIIYTKQGEIDEAIRVCKAYVEASERLAEAIKAELGDRKLAEQLGNPLDFPEWIVKLQRKKQRLQEKKRRAKQRK